MSSRSEELDAQPVAAGVPSIERLRAIVRAHFSFVWRTALRLGLPEDAADDAAQQVFIVLARRIDDVTEGSEKAFLYRTTAHVVAEARRTHARRAQRMKPADDVEIDAAKHPDPGPDEALDQKRARAMLTEIIEQLEDDVRPVFVLFELEHVPVPEIATLLEIPEGTAASRLRRAREQFQRIAHRMRARATTRGVPEGREP